MPNESSAEMIVSVSCFIFLIKLKCLLAAKTTKRCNRSFLPANIQIKSQSRLILPWDLWIFGILPVILNQILHKLRVTEISGSCIVLVHLSNLSHIIVTQREVKNVDILRHALLMTRLGNSYDASLGFAPGNASFTSSTQLASPLPYFSRYCTKHLGQTPSDYRLSLQPKKGNLRDWISCSGNVKVLQSLGLQDFVLGCPVGLEPTTFRTTSGYANVLKSLYSSVFPQFLIFDLRLFCGYLRKDRFCFNKSLKIWDESLLNSSAIIKWQTFFKSDAKVDKVIK